MSGEFQSNPANRLWSHTCNQTKGTATEMPPWNGQQVKRVEAGVVRVDPVLHVSNTRV